MEEKVVVSGNRLIVGYLGLFIIISGIICLLPLLVLPFYPNEVKYAKCFIVPAILAIFLGYLLFFLIRDKNKASLSNHDDAKLLISVWIIAILIGAVPFMLHGDIDWLSALFESVSGFTTCCISFLVPESLPHIFLFYRTLILFFGGIGIVLVLTSAISDKYGMKLYSAEGHSDKLVPNLMRSARLILSIYFVYIIIGALLYWAFGMTPFDAINHSISSLCTGGFSTHSEGIGYYNNLGIEIVTVILMMLGATNFVIHLFLIKGKFKELKKHTEFKFAFIIIILATLILTLSISAKMGFFTGLRYSVFTVFSLFTTTGYSSDFFAVYPSSLFLLFLFIVFCGGELGSTGGGIKRYRMALFFKGLWWNLKSKYSDKRLIQSHYMYRAGKKIVISNDDIIQNNTFIGWFFIVYFIGVALFCADGVPLSSALIDFAGVLTGTGMSLGVVSYDASPLTLITSIFGMFFGRLEIIVILLFIAKSITTFKRKLFK